MSFLSWIRNRVSFSGCEIYGNPPEPFESWEEWGLWTLENKAFRGVKIQAVDKLCCKCKKGEGANG
jgi:hypothetical protein